MEIKKNAEENLEQLGKQEKYLFSLNGSFRQEDEIDRGLIMRKQRQEMMIPVRDQDGERAGPCHRDIAYIAPASKKDDELMASSLN